jgi:hypothetical protein
MENKPHSASAASHSASSPHTEHHRTASEAAQSIAPTLHRSPHGLLLEPIEKASLDELRALQLQRLKTSLTAAYESVPHYRHRFD